MTAIADMPQADALAVTTEPCPPTGASLYDLIVDLRTQSDVNLALVAGSKPLFDMIFNELEGQLRDQADRYSWLIYALNDHMRALHDGLDRARQAAAAEPPMRGIALFNQVNDTAEFDRAFDAYTMATNMVEHAPRDANESAFDRAADIQTEALNRLIRTPAWSMSDVVRKIRAIVTETGEVQIDGGSAWEHPLTDLLRLSRQEA